MQDMDFSILNDLKNAQLSNFRVFDDKSDIVLLH